jgi:ABC-type glycerol-3-phosphate transport system substrate-binding protein
MTRRRIMLTLVVLAVLAACVAATPATAQAAGFTAGSLKMVTFDEDSFWNYDYDKGSSSTFPDPSSAGHNDWR